MEDKESRKAIPQRTMAVTADSDVEKRGLLKGKAPEIRKLTRLRSAS